MNKDKLILKVLKEQRGFTPRKTPPSNIKSILSQIELFEMYPKIFAVVIKNDKLRARVFMRYQEFYESDSDSFRGKGFKWQDYTKFYKEKTKNDIFTYHEDWAGYNIPCDSIESCISMIPDIIGIDQSTGDDPSLIFHEVAHGLWFSTPSYRNKQFSNIENMNQSVRNQVAKKITGMGYAEKVVDDEIQAYLSTGIGDNMKRIKDIKQAQIPFKNVFDQYSGKIKPKRIQIDWSTDLD
jgi:hypothetical protein